jgi:hypothetical protein
MKEMSDPSRAKTDFIDVGSRTVTRIVSVYGLTGDIQGEGPGSLTGVWELGRFTPHVDAAGFLLPRPVVSVALDDGDLELPGTPPRLTGARVVLVRTPRSDLALVIDATCDAADGEAVAAVLAATCFDRFRLRVRGEPLIEWLRSEIAASGHEPPERLGFGRDVHQCVFPGGPLLDEIRRGGPYWHIVYRVTEPADGEERTGIFRPAALNYPDVTVVGHGRGVSVLAGWTEPVENAFALIAITLVTALGVLHRARRNAFAAMAEGGRVDLDSTADARAVVSALSAQLNELQLDLSFGVEAYLDSVLVPEIVISGFQRSMCEALMLVEGLEHTSRMLERLDSVIEIRRTALAAAVQEQHERRDRIFSGIVAAGSLLAVPPAILLAFFGANATEVDPRRSIFDLHRYWGVYLLVWLPYVLLVAVGFVLQRRIRGRSRQLHIYDEALRRPT